MKLYNKANTSVENVKIYICKSGTKRSWLTFLQFFFFCGKQNHYFHFDKNHSFSKPAEQLLSLNNPIQLKILLKR